MDYTMVITESRGELKCVQKSYSFSPSSDILTLSLGVLFSGIEQRSYVSVKDPSNTQQNLLSVNGRGHSTPLGVALLNYKIPGARFSNDRVGLNLSSGLVLDFGASEAKASPLGWFGGPSLDLWHRLFMSVGFHIGQFADFPPGLGGGSVIPASFGELTPVKRWTTRFAFAVTYQTTGFGKTTSKATVSSNPPPAPDAGPQPPTGAKPNPKTPPQKP